MTLKTSDIKLPPPQDFPRLSGEPEAQSDKVTGLVFVGYKKAFDLIDHNLLLSKLELIGIGKDFSRHYLLIT